MFLAMRSPDYCPFLDLRNHVITSLCNPKYIRIYPIGQAAYRQRMGRYIIVESYCSCSRRNRSCRQRYLWAVFLRGFLHAG